MEDAMSNPIQEHQEKKMGKVSSDRTKTINEQMRGVWPVVIICLIGVALVGYLTSAIWSSPYVLFWGVAVGVTLFFIGGKVRIAMKKSRGPQNLLWAASAVRYGGLAFALSVILASGIGHVTKTAARDIDGAAECSVSPHSSKCENWKKQRVASAPQTARPVAATSTVVTASPPPPPKPVEIKDCADAPVGMISCKEVTLYRNGESYVRTGPSLHCARFEPAGIATLEQVVDPATGAPTAIVELKMNPHLQAGQVTVRAFFLPLGATYKDYTCG